MVPIEGYLLPSAVMSKHSSKHTSVRHDASLTTHPQPFRTPTARSPRTQYNHHTFFTHRLIRDPSILPFIAVSLHVDRTFMRFPTHICLTHTRNRSSDLSKGALLRHEYYLHTMTSFLIPCTLCLHSIARATLLLNSILTHAPTPLVRRVYLLGFASRFARFSLDTFLA